MKTPLRMRPIDLLAITAIVAFVGYKMYDRPRSTSAGGPSEFSQQVQLDPLYEVALQADGRLRSYESHAATYMAYVSGRRSIEGQTSGFTYLDMLFRPERYVSIDTIYVKNKNVRAEILDVLRDHPKMDAERSAEILKRGLFSRELLGDPAVGALLHELGADLIRTSKSVDAIQQALGVSTPRFLEDGLRLIAPPSGNVNEPWFSITQLMGATPKDAAHAGMAFSAIPGLDETTQKELVNIWGTLRLAWLDEDASTVNQQLAALAAIAPTIAPDLYPSTGRLGMESWYFRTKSMTWVWLIYLVSVVPLLLSVINKWDGARKVGMVMFVIAFLFHTASLGIRWYISGRWPNANMFEAVTTSAWFGGVGAIILERIARRGPFRNLFALGSAVLSMGSLMVAYFLPAQLDPGINNKMAALNDVWLYIHTNMIIWGYAVIGLACVPALLMLRHRWCTVWDQGMVPKLRMLLLPIAAVVLNFTAYKLLMHVLDDPARELSMNAFIGVSGAFWGSLMILLMELLSARARRLSGVRVERAASGGAGAMMAAAAPSGGSFLKAERPTAGQVYDGATMVLVELSFVMLWVGIVMGAIWADHSWGRPWGWDPKEVFALNTFVIFLVLIHVRLKVRDKAFWTAVLAIVGFEVMMFNWIVVNFVITGLHSYA